MMYHLSSVTVTVKNSPVTALGDSPIGGDLLCREVHFSQNFPIIIRNIIGGGDMLSRNDQNVMRRLGIDVIESENRIIFVDDVTGNLTIRNLTEQTVIHVHCTFQPSARRSPRK